MHLWRRSKERKGGLASCGVFGSLYLAVFGRPAGPAPAVPWPCSSCWEPPGPSACCTSSMRAPSPPICSPSATPSRGCSSSSSSACCPERYQARPCLGPHSYTLSSKLPCCGCRSRFRRSTTGFSKMCRVVLNA